MKNDYSMGKYILSLLNAKKMVFWSWGPSNAVLTPNGLLFHVQGFKFKGVVKVEYDTALDLFNVTFTPNRSKNVHTEEGVYFDQLVDVIDDYVEKTTDYTERVTNWLNNEHKSED